MKITVLLAVYNGEAHCAAALDSILRQTRADFELVVVDDGSTDRTSEILRSCQDTRVRVVGHPTNRGRSAAFNTGIRLATGDVILHIGADDLALPRLLEVEARFLEQHPEIALVSCACQQIDDQGRTTRLLVHFAEDAQIKRHMALQPREAFMSHGGCMIRRAALLDVGLYDETLAVTVDKDIYLRLAAKDYRFANLPHVLYAVRKRAGVHRTAEYRAEHERTRQIVHARHQRTLQRLARQHRHLGIPELVRGEVQPLERQGYSNLYAMLATELRQRRQMGLARRSALLAAITDPENDQAYYAWLYTFWLFARFSGATWSRALLSSSSMNLFRQRLTGLDHAAVRGRSWTSVGLFLQLVWNAATRHSMMSSKTPASGLH